MARGGASLACWLLVVAITAGVHEPLNAQLRTDVDLDDADALAVARTRLDEASWTAWNMVRAALSTGAFAALVVALALRRPARVART